MKCKHCGQKIKRCDRCAIVSPERFVGEWCHDTPRGVHSCGPNKNAEPMEDENEAR